MKIMLALWWLSTTRQSAHAWTRALTHRRSVVRLFSCFDPDAFVARQRQVSSDQQRQASSETYADFIAHQKSVFDEMAASFADGETIGEELVPVYEHLGQQIVDTNTTLILDLACGAGALFDYLLAATDHPLSITGVDLSPRMVEAAKKHAQALTKDSPHSIQVVESDLMQYTPEAPFDAAIANACFANFWDPAKVLEHVAKAVRLGGRIWISHPLGASFVAELHAASPSTVPHCLPSRPQLTTLCMGLPLRVENLQESVEINGQKREIYLASLTKVRYRTLEKLVRLRGRVDAGYGRGGKKLGFPTANLRASLFQNALESLSTGVYFGWAGVEGVKGIHKAVVNIGYSPTFEGAENKEKIVEAHLITKEPLEDFYNSTMRLQLHAFLRDEQKFDAFPALIAQISADKEDSKEALDREPFSEFAHDAFLSTMGRPWVGKSGGDETASWEFEDIYTALDVIRR